MTSVEVAIGAPVVGTGKPVLRMANTSGSRSFGLQLTGVTVVPGPHAAVIISSFCLSRL